MKTIVTSMTMLSLVFAAACSDSTPSEPAEHEQAQGASNTRAISAVPPAVPSAGSSTIADVFTGAGFRFLCSSGVRFEGPRGVLDVVRVLDHANNARDFVEFGFGGRAPDGRVFAVQIRRFVNPGEPWEWKERLVSPYPPAQGVYVYTLASEGAEIEPHSGTLEIKISNGVATGVVHVDDESLGKVEFWGWPDSRCGDGLDFTSPRCHPYVPMALTKAHRKALGFE